MDITDSSEDLKIFEADQPTDLTAVVEVELEVAPLVTEPGVTAMADAVPTVAPTPAERGSAGHVPAEPASDAADAPAPPPRVADPDAVALLSLLSTGATHLGVGVLLPNGKKEYYPTAIKNESERRSLIEAHLAGAIPPRLCLSKGETFLVQNPFALAYPAVIRLSDQFKTNAITFDVDGPGHADGLTAEHVDQRTWAIADVAEDAGLTPTVVRSNSATGRHVVIPMPDLIDAGLAVYIAQGVIALVPGAEGTEIFPRTATLREGQFGRWVAFPLNGAAPKPGGGRIINRHGNELPASSVGTPELSVINAFRPLYKRQQAAEERIRAARRAEGILLSHLSHASGKSGNASDATLEQVVRTFATIADDREKEQDIIAIQCPTHGGTCFHCNVDIGWYCCHKCGHKGAGQSAPYTLLRLLRPDWTHAQLRSELSALHQKSNEPGSPT